MKRLKKTGYKNSVNCQPLENETDRRRRMTREMQIERRAKLRTNKGENRPYKRGSGFGVGWRDACMESLLAEFRFLRERKSL